jgi:hypothetical protein
LFVPFCFRSCLFPASVSHVCKVFSCDGLLQGAKSGRKGREDRVKYGKQKVRKSGVDRATRPRGIPGFPVLMWY